MIERGAPYLRRYLDSLGRVGQGLLVLTAVEITALVILRVAAPHSLLELCIQVALAVTFATLAIVDLKTALAVAVLELIVCGASGRWTELPGGVTGRMLLDATLATVALVRLVPAWRVRGWVVLGRYGLHAVAVALVIPVIWMPLGALNGYPVGNVIADGDGFLFFGFALLLAAAALFGDLSWLRRWILVACAINAVLSTTLFAIGASRLVSEFHFRALLLETFDFGGQVAFFTTGQFRLHLASGLFLQIGVALACWELIRAPRRWWPWLLLAVLVAALLGSFGRGYFLGAFIAAVIVLFLGRRSSDRPVTHTRARVLVLAAVIAIAAVGFSLLQAGAGADANLVKLYQAQVLLGHVIERPLLGWGFGAVAPDYLIGDHFSYEITYLDRAFKLGLVGLVIFLSLPFRLALDSIRVLLDRLPAPPGLPAGEASVPLAILVSVLVVSATNPYLAGSVGIGAVILCIAWLDPFD